MCVVDQVIHICEVLAVKKLQRSVDSYPKEAVFIHRHIHDHTVLQPFGHPKSLAIGESGEDLSCHRVRQSDDEDTAKNSFQHDTMDGAPAAITDSALQQK